jgi:hypothetical protein
MAKPDLLSDITANPDTLNQLSLSELRALWGQCCPKIPPSPIKMILLRDLATLAQQGGHKMPRQTDALIRSAMKAASVSRNSEKAAIPIKAIVSDSPKLPEGAKLVRQWGGRTHEVNVLKEGRCFRYQNQNYKSLTQVAKVITGAHWSGPRFFGLYRCREIG